MPYTIMVETYEGNVPRYFGAFGSAARAERVAEGWRRHLERRYPIAAPDGWSVRVLPLAPVASFKTTYPET